MAGVRPLTEEEKELISLYGKPITVYDILQAFSQDKLSENGHPNFDVSVKPDAFTNGVLTYDLEEHNRVNTYLYRTDIRSRQFYHSQTLQPMTLEEVLSDADSDNEDDQEFKDFQERMKIDRLVDASDEEKRFMWLWNTFIRKQRVYADKHVPWACEEFVKLHAKELITPKLLWQWRMFAVDTLCLKYGLICAKTMDKCSTRKSARTQKKKKQEAASSSKANANGNEPQPMELDEEQH
uniref:Polycomb protein VEFS-Box domain-containing protein n=1 Tax=Brassica campestris TaxID=3711 RepID=M4CM79_BRACM